MILVHLQKEGGKKHRGRENGKKNPPHLKLPCFWQLPQQLQIETKNWTKTKIEPPPLILSY